MPCVYDDVPGSWATQSEGWPSIDDPDEVARMLVIKNKLVPYGSYVTVDGRLRLETPEYVERVRAALEAASPNPVRAEQPSINPAPVDSKLIDEQPDSRSRMRRIAIEKGEPAPRFAEQPEGKWKLVPVEPTHAMELALSNALASGDYSIGKCLEIALAAAPAAPGAAVGVDELERLTDVVHEGAVADALLHEKNGWDVDHRRNIREGLRLAAKRGLLPALTAALAGKDGAK